MKILIPIDGSDSSRSTLEWAAATLDKTTARYYLISVVSDPMIAEYEIEDANRFLDEARGILEAKGCTVAQAEYMMGAPALSICGYADETGIDMVLMGSHGRSGLAKVFLGSVSEQVLEHCARPVLIYRTVVPHGAYTKKETHGAGNILFS